MSDEPILGLYFDEGCTQMLGKRVVGDEALWLIDFGRVNAGESKTSGFYIKNISLNKVEGLEVSIEPASRDGVSAEVVAGGRFDELSPGASGIVEVRWTATSGVKAGSCRAPLSFSGVLVEEEHRLS